MSTPDKIMLWWLAGMSAWTFLMFGFDKWRAGRSGGRRTPEASLLLASALGGWPGGLLGILFFRHKSSKPSFLLKFAGTFIVWMVLVAEAWKLRH